MTNNVVPSEAEAYYDMAQLLAALASFGLIIDPESETDSLDSADRDSETIGRELESFFGEPVEEDNDTSIDSEDDPVTPPMEEAIVKLDSDILGKASRDIESPTADALPNRHLPATRTKTVQGMRRIHQPIETCFQPLTANDSKEDNKATVEEPEDEPEVGDCQQWEVVHSTHDLTPDSVPPPNRTFSNDWFRIDNSPISGYGVFATRYIPQYEAILLEKPFITSNEHKILADYTTLCKSKKEVYDSLHGWSGSPDKPREWKVWNANVFELPGSVPDRGLIAIASNFNHACGDNRNVRYCWDPSRACMVFTTCQAIEAGQELFISYGGSRSMLAVQYGFECGCGACEGPLELKSQFDFGWVPTAGTAFL